MQLNPRESLTFFTIAVLINVLTACSGMYLTAEDYAHDQAVQICNGPYPADKRQAWISYGECLQSHKDSFVTAVTCGKESRNKSCAAHDCAPDVVGIVDYSDVLVEQVQNKKISEKDAFKKWHAFADKGSTAFFKNFNDNNARARECYERTYPGLVSSERARRTAIDAEINANMQRNRPKYTSCSSTVFSGTATTNCTTY